MVAWRYEISLLVLKNIYLLRCAHSANIFLTLEISARVCNILYLPQSYKWVEICNITFIAFEYSIATLLALHRDEKCNNDLIG